MQVDLIRFPDCRCCGRPVWQSGTCECGHSVLVHDLNSKNERTRCLTAEGPKGTQCGCRKYTGGEA